MEFTSIYKNIENKKEKDIKKEDLPKTTTIQEHHLTSDIHIRERGHKSETVTHCTHKDSNMTEKDIHDKNK